MWYVFGDSWAEGYGLKEGEKNFAKWIAHLTDEKVVNHGECASSLGQITHTALHESVHWKEGDRIVVVTPPDTRWYNITNDRMSYSIFENTEERDRFIQDKNVAWFKYQQDVLWSSRCPSPDARARAFRAG